MKTFLSCFATLFLIAGTTFAQISSPFPQDSARWEISYTCYDGGPNPYLVSEEIWIDGDTLIDNQNYIVLKDDMGSDVFALVKVIGNEVYFKGYYEFPDTASVLIYDYDLEAGDVFYYPDYLQYGDSVVIEAVDTIPFSDGVDRKRLKLSQPYQNICNTPSSYWIEEMGSIDMSFYFRDCFECMVNGFKFWRKGILVFDNVVVNTKEAYQPAINIYPNPANHSFVIDGGIPEIEKVSLIDLRGKEVFSQKNIANKSAVDLPPQIAGGIYLLKIEIEEGKHIIKKLVVN